MYSVYIESLQGDKKNLYYPADSEYVITDSVLSMEVGIAGEFTFKVPAINPSYSEIKQGAIVTIMRDGAEYWRGEVRTVSTDFNKTLDVYCVEDLAWLADEYLWVLRYTNKTYAQMFQMWLDEYNRRSSTRTFSVGMITNHTSAELCDFATNYDMSVLDALRANICGDTGYLRVRRVTNNGTVTRYIDCVRLEDYGSMANQEIRFGENLLSYVREMDMSNFTNALYPFGAETDTEIYEGQRERIAGTQLYNNTSINAFGRHAKTVVFDTDDLATLNNLAQAYITRYSQPQITFELSAIDMADIDANVEHFNLGDSVRVIAESYAVDQRVYITNLDINLQDISNNKIVMSGHAPEARTLTQQTVNQAELIKTIPSESKILDAAKKNAFEILEGVDGGYVRFEKNDNDVITAIVISNASTDAQSTKKWVFNSGGLGHYTRDSVSESWSTVNVAMTMDGSVVAEAITAGTLTGQTINGATINGGSINGGSINGATFTQNTRNGNLSIRNGWIYGSSGQDDGSAMVLTGQYGSETLYGSLWMHAFFDGSPYAQAHTYNVVHAGELNESDRRLKEKINPIEPVKSKEIIENTNVYSFSYKKHPDKLHFGVIAQELLETLINAGYSEDEIDTVYKFNAEGMYGVSYVELIPHLMNYVKDLQNQIDQLKGEKING